MRLAVMIATGAGVLATLWLVNGPDLVAGWLGLPWNWVRSPLA